MMAERGIIGCADPQEQPIAALLEHWLWLGDQRVGEGRVTYAEIAADLKNAIQAQRARWKEEQRGAIGYEEQAYAHCIHDLDPSEKGTSDV